MILIDKLCYTSRLRFINSGVKVFFAILTLLLCIVDRSISISLLILCATGYLTMQKGGIKLSVYLRLMRIPLVFLILSTLAILVNVSHQPMDAFAIPLGALYLTGSTASILHAGQLIATALASVSCLYFLSLSTPMTDLLVVMQKIHLPGLIVELMLLIYRFIFLLFDTANALTMAQVSRLGNRDFKTSCHSFGSMASALFLKAFQRSNALYDAMESRCYDGTIHVLSEDYPVNKKHLLFILLFEIILILSSLGLRKIGLHY